MADSYLIPFLYQFVIRPFPDEKKARELLSEIENRQLTDIEFERWSFCLQLASCQTLRHRCCGNARLQQNLVEFSWGSYES
jgi:hypothetical protein